MRHWIIVTALVFLCSLSAGAGDFKIVFETTDCSGETGFASVGADTIYKIESAGCAAPGGSGEKLKQMLVKNSAGSYDTFTLTAAEAATVRQEMKAYMKVRLKQLENANSLIITK